jgi:hypothetical protein
MIEYSHVFILHSNGNAYSMYSTDSDLPEYIRTEIVKAIKATSKEDE